MALVGQMPTLFSGSIKENICLGIDRDISLHELDAALEMANAKSFVYLLPEVRKNISVTQKRYAHF